MKKKIIVFLALVILISAFTLTACADIKNNLTAVAKIDGKKVTRTEYLESWENVKKNYGVTQDILDNPEYTVQLDELRINVLESLVSREITKIELENLGYYDLTPDELNSVKTQTESFLDEILATKESEMLAELGDDYTEKDYVRAANKYTQLILEEFGVEESYIEEYYTYQIVMQNAETSLIDLTVTDEELLELFNQKVEADKITYSDLSAYEYYTSQGEPAFYIPEGLRMVRHVLISFEDDLVAQIQELRSAGNEEEADELVNTSLAEIYDEAMDVLNQLNDESITFDDAILEYNDDPGMNSYPEGYQMYLGTSRFVQEFTDGGMALENIGDISDLVGTDFGYHILEYTSDVESGPVDFETVKASLLPEASEIKKEEEWLALINEWTAKHKIEYFYENLEEEPIEEPTAEPTQTEVAQ